MPEVLRCKVLKIVYHWRPITFIGSLPLQRNDPGYATHGIALYQCNLNINRERKMEIIDKVKLNLEQ